MLIAVFNASSLVTNDEARIMTQACYHQVRYHAAPAWGMTVPAVIYYTLQSDIPTGAWKIGIFDNADQAGVLGWHSEGPDGLPYGRVFAKPVFDHKGTSLRGGLTVASVLSHEILEAFVDPACNRFASDEQGSLWCLEVGDPVESYSYTVSDDHGNLADLSDFALPNWFDYTAGGKRCDYMNKVVQPFTLGRGGYAIKEAENSSTAVFGDSVPIGGVTSPAPLIGFAPVFDAKYPDWKREMKLADLANDPSRTARRLRQVGSYLTK